MLGRLLVVVFVTSHCISSAFASGGHHFDYVAGYDWGGICSTGLKQSPINIDDSTNVESGAWQPMVWFGSLGTVTNYTVFFTGHNLEIEFHSFDPEADLLIPTDDYMLSPWDTYATEFVKYVRVRPKQMHIHTMSEHTRNGHQFPAELHIVMEVLPGQTQHCDEEAKPCLVVFGVLLRSDGDGFESQPSIRYMFSFIDSLKEAGMEHGVNVHGSLWLDGFLPWRHDYYYYRGSLTTPPCSEKVSWYVFANPLSISTDLVESHQKLVAHTYGPDCPARSATGCEPPREKTNHRRLQRANGRRVTLFRE